MLIEYLEKVTRAETEHDVDSFLYQDVHLWPLFRYEVLLKFRNSEQYLSKKFQLAEQGVAGRIKAFLGGANDKRQISQFIKQVKKSQVLIVDAHSKLSEFGDQVYNPFLDPMLELCQEQHKTVSKVALYWRDSIPDKSSLFKTIPLIKDLFFTGYLKANKHRSKMQKTVEPFVLEMERISGIEINHQHFLHQLDRVLLAQYTYDQVLSQLNSKLVFFECFYKPEMFGLILSCKRLGIKTVDIQHGKQGTHHLMYSHWVKVPKGGYLVLPDYFWNWGEQSAINIQRHSHGNIDAHRTIVGGNLWLAKWINASPKVLDDSWRQFLETVKSYKKVVLISLQPSSFEQDSAIPDFVQSVIRNSDTKSTLWLIRKHPSEKNLDSDINRLGEMENVELNFSSKLPLFLILKAATHHITKFSSVAFEANVFGVPTILIHKAGQQLYEEQIKNKQFYYTVNSEEIMSLLNQESLETAPMEYIDTNLETAKNAFQEIWNKARN